MSNTDKQINVLKLFNSMVVTAPAKTLDYSLFESLRIVTDFSVTPSQKKALQEVFAPIKAKTLFGREERRNSTSDQLIMKQLLHYIEVYGLNSPGLFNLEVEENVVVPVRYIKGINSSELGEMVRKLIYTNAPVKDSKIVKEIINDYDLSYDFDQILNNEVRIVLFDENRDVFENGDDAVRYMCLKATGTPLLIKSKNVIDAIKPMPVVKSRFRFAPKQKEPVSFSSKFFEAHKLPLAQVFNRHKAIILAAKTEENRTAINSITRLSKTKHVPVHESVGKRFISLALDNKVNDKIMAKLSLRDKFKILNLLEYKRQGNSIDAFVIRNGKVHIEENRPILDSSKVEEITAMILNSLKSDLSHLKNTTILLDKNVDYGLPVSRKQTIGNLPFGTEITIDGGRISSGVYWRDEWGARDLDLSTIDRNGHRTGWGNYRGYSLTNPVVFSGDVTSAPNGAMEFMTSRNESYGLFVNIFNGEINSSFEMVIGRDGKDHWIEDVVIREKHTPNSKGSVIGFVDGNKYTVYAGRLNDRLVSDNEKSKAVVSRGTSSFWTVKTLFDMIGVDYSLDSQEGVEYLHDMSYKSFSYDKLEKLLLNKESNLE